MSWTPINPSSSLCTQPDEFLEEKAIWIVTLSDGTKVYQDDDRPGVDEPSAWIRLGHYLREAGLGIVGMELRFRSHVVPLPSDVPGYYFARGIKRDAIAGSKNQHFLCAGIQIGDTVVYGWFRTPELLNERQVVKKVDEVEPPWLFQNPEIHA